jgi:hypothetical protein
MVRAINVTVEKGRVTEEARDQSSRVAPDQEVPNVPTTPIDETLEAAKQWVVSQPAAKVARRAAASR